MTSLAILPHLKRSITDIMDEELYHAPPSPIQFSNATTNTNTLSITNQQQQQYQLAPQQHNINTTMNYTASKNSVNSSPTLTHQNSFNISNTNLGNFLNIPDSFLDQIKQQNAYSWENTNPISQQQQHQFAFPSVQQPTPHPASQQQQQNQQQQPQPQFVQQPYPFTDYANPNSFIRPQSINRQMSPPPIPLPQAFPPRTRRRRITTIDDAQESSTSNKKKYDQEYLLYNPDISPAHIISQTDLESSFIVQPKYDNTTMANDIIPGYENDYLFMDDDEEVEDIEEDIEEDLSDEEDDDDNYFHVDEEFDEFMMNGPWASGYTVDPGYSIVKQEFEQQMRNETQVFIPPVEHQLQEEEVHDLEFDDDEMMIDEQNEQVHVKQEQQQSQQIPEQQQQQQQQEHPEEQQPVLPEQFQEMNTPPTSSSKKSSSHHHSKSAAEISATNPHHKCDLINPSTGLICNKQFSRPYDLIRHQETIHATKKKIFRCVICEGRRFGGPGNGKSKTFSRVDALSRHVKVKHNLVGKEALDLVNEAKENVEYVMV
ncbi:RPN4 [[Candida] subhashii]|uniref:RPN4 n=1 Tax=[Candida] subhashii TaxID=561895 RepID=A0A8J5UHE6_9ASCO|nr:RPN4 [[Candida] subhashii]KAG7660797.1 RPN4 [[Candida] subhashii]